LSHVQVRASNTQADCIRRLHQFPLHTKTPPLYTSHSAIFLSIQTHSYVCCLFAGVALCVICHLANGFTVKWNERLSLLQQMLHCYKITLNPCVFLEYKIKHRSSRQVLKHCFHNEPSLSAGH